MTEIYDEIKNQVVKGLTVQVKGLKKISQPDSTANRSSLQIGDQIEFSLLARNDNPFDLDDLHFYIHQMAAVELYENPVKARIRDLPKGDEKLIVTLKGTIVSNPNDVRSPWTQLDSLCRVKITGTIHFQPIPFEDIEVETINVTDS